ncbi:MAG: sugar ABC transporter permease [Oscillospiraceae bacterium]|nr:sugar ABC transporter permease [Oscillospiraceae bacterium]
MKLRMPKMARKPLTLERKVRRAGFLFLLPWLFGIITFFVIPFVNTFLWSFQRIDISARTFTFTGFTNFDYAFRENRDFLRSLIESVGSMFGDVIIILVFSFFIALILNQKFYGRTIARALFFLPVIVASSIVITIIREDVFTQRLMSGTGETEAIFQTAAIGNLLNGIGLPPQAVDIMTTALADIFDLTWKTGMQIILFLSGLQSIPDSYYEVASIEGANAWDSFWKITAPMVTPSIMLVVIYSIIDTFTNPANPVMRVIMTEISPRLDWGAASAMAMVLFLVIGVIIGLFMLCMRKAVFYNE